MASSTSSRPSGVDLRRLIVALAALTLAACATQRTGDRLRDAEREVAAELTGVPFFPQESHQCGPAALATVLGASGVDVVPEALVPRVYLPGKRGSLQAELVAASRQYGRLPYELDADFAAIAREVRAGRPVLVLQNLGLRSLPRWHYAAVVGVTRTHVILRSGRHERLGQRKSSFMRTWDYGGRWAIVLLPPGELPAAAHVERWLSANAALEAVGQRRAAQANYEAAVRVWDHPLVWLGLGNAAYHRGERATAERAYRRAVELDGTNPSALNNLAQVLGERGCVPEARGYLGRARTLAGPALREAIELTGRGLGAAAPAPMRGSCTAAPEGPND